MNSTTAVVVAAAIHNATTTQNCPQRDFFNPVVTLATQMFAILVMVQLFQLLLKLCGQPGPVAQILAGLVLGPTVLCRLGIVRNFFFQNVLADYFRTVALFSRQIIVFVMGLEVDLPSFKRLSKPSIIVAFGSALMSCTLAIGIVPYIFQRFKDSVDHASNLPFMFTMIIANTASPVVWRLVSDLKIASSRVGRLASYSSLINDSSCLIVVGFVRMFIDVRSFGKNFGSMLLAVAIDAVCIFLFHLIAKYLNNTRRFSKYLTNTEVVLAVVLVMMLAFFNESMGQNSLIPCFLAGAMLPREGKTIRSLIRKLSYPVYVFLIPIYFGYLGFQIDFERLFEDLRMIGVLVAIVLVSFGGKISGILLACRYLKMPLAEGVVLALLLNVKGFIDLLVLDMTMGNDNSIDRVVEVYRLARGVVVIDTLLAGVVAAIIVNIDKTTFGHRHTSLELQTTTCSELRLLACVHHSRHVWTMVGLIAMMIGDGGSPILPNLTQLIELPKRTNNLTFHEQEDGGNNFSKGAADDYVGNDVVEINEAVDEFITKTNITMQQSKIVSPVATLYEDVCSNAEDLQASMIIVSWHKHQRIDGQMEDNKKTGIRTTNQKILGNAPCSVGILVDKGGIFGGLEMPSSNMTQHVATLFFGGPDDREALAYSSIIGLHPNINLTVIRFIHGSTRECEINVKTQENDEVLMEITSPAKQCLIDTTFLSDFFNRYVSSGQIGFVEKYVNNGADTLKVLKEMEDMYSLFLVGKGGGENSPLTEGMSYCEECSELGKIGDLLASSEMDVRGSILVIQQHRGSTTECESD